MVETQKSEASELDGLPDAARKETQEIIEEIEKDENKNPDQQPGNDAEKTAAEAKAKADAEAAAAAGKGGKTDEAKQEPPRRPIKLMPSYVHEIAIKDRDKKIEELTTALADAKAGKGTDTAQQPKPDAEAQASLEKEIAAVAEANGLKPETVKALVELGMKHGGKLPAEVQAKLEKVDAYTADIEAKAEESAYNSAFDEHVLPLIKAEYGEDVAADTIAAIRDGMKGKAYSKEFQQTPYSVIYKGVDDFRKFTRTAAKSAEQSRGGAHGSGADSGGNAAGEEAQLFESATEADIEKMAPDVFDRYSTWQQNRERNRG